jgi:HEAT repeat protein
MADEIKTAKDQEQAKEGAKPADAASAMPDGSMKSDSMPSGPVASGAEVEAPVEGAVEAPVQEEKIEEKVKDEVEIQIDLLKDKDWFRRKDAAITLGDMGDERAIGPLITALRDPEWNVREAAQISLGQIGSPAVEPLIKALREYQIRTFVIQVLGKIKDERVLDPLMLQLRNEEFKDVATQALAEIGLPAVDRLMAVLNDKDKNVRKHAVMALGEIGIPEAVEPLIDATKDEDWQVRLQAMAALDKIGDERGKPAIKALVKDPDFAVQMRAERILWAWKKKAKQAKDEEEEETAGTA